MRNYGNGQYGNYDSRANRIAGGILIIIISAISCLSLFGLMGGVGKMIAGFLIGVFGLVSYAYAVCGVILGVMVTAGKRVTLPANKAFKYLFLLSLGVMCFHVYFYIQGYYFQNGAAASYGDYLSACYKGETAAGVLGGLVAWIFMKMFTPAFALVFFIVLFAVVSLFSFYPMLVNRLPYRTKKTKIKSNKGKKPVLTDIAEEGREEQVIAQPVGSQLFVGTIEEDGQAPAFKAAKRKKGQGFSPLFPNQIAGEEASAKPPVFDSETDRRKRAKEKLFGSKKEEQPVEKTVDFTPSKEEDIKPSLKTTREPFSFDPKKKGGTEGVYEDGVRRPKNLSEAFDLPESEDAKIQDIQERYGYILNSEVTPKDIRGAASRHLAEPKRKKSEPAPEPEPEDIKEDGKNNSLPPFIQSILDGDSPYDRKKSVEQQSETPKNPDEEEVKSSRVDVPEPKVISSINHDVSPEKPKNEDKGENNNAKGSIFSMFGGAPVKKTEPKPIERPQPTSPVEPPKPVVYERPATETDKNKNDLGSLNGDGYNSGYEPVKHISSVEDNKEKSDAVMPTPEEIKSAMTPLPKEEKPRQPYAPREVKAEDKPEKKDTSYTNNFNIGSRAKPVGVTPKSESKKVAPEQISIDQAIVAQHQRKPYMAPPIELLKKTDDTIIGEDFSEKIEKLEQVFSDFRIDAKVIGVTQGPTFSRFELMLPAGISVTAVSKYADDIAMKLKLQGAIRFETPIPGKDAFGVEIANNVRTSVGLRGMLEDSEFNTSKKPLTFALGRDIANKNHYCNIDSMPHLLIAGSTGSGKSVCINTLIVSLLYRCSPTDLKFILVDPKKVELSLYNGLPHLLVPRVIDDVNSAVNALDYCLREMDARFDLFSVNGCRNLDEFNEIARSTPGMVTRPRIVIIFDELADFMAQRKRDVEDRINRIARLARAAGIHLVVATQRPSVDVITGTIKSNLPSRIAFFVKQASDSMTILGYGGAEKLLGRGDMLYYPQGGDTSRLQCAFVDTPEARSVVNYIKEHNEAYFEPDAQNQIFKQPEDENEKEDEAPVSYAHTAVGKNGESQLFIDALYMCVKEQKASVSKIQRKFSVGYGTAANIIELMEDKGYVSPNKGGNSQRDVLLSMAQFNEYYGAREDDGLAEDFADND